MQYRRRTKLINQIILSSFLSFYFRSHIYEVPDVEELYDNLMNLILRFGNYGVIHGDFNEFNIMLTEENLKPIIIDFPQMISIHHPNAREYVKVVLPLNLRPYFLYQIISSINEGYSIAM